jgi:hypothetical protein
MTRRVLDLLEAEGRPAAVDLENAVASARMVPAQGGT